MSALSSSKTVRNSSIELLRILAMIFIVLSHSSVHGGFPDAVSAVGFNNYLLDSLVLGNLGVDIFVIISGYFLSTKEFKPQNVLKLLGQVWFFSYLCFFVFMIAGGTPSLNDIIQVILPTIFKEYWFFTAYIVLILLSDYINLILRNTTQRQMLTLLSIMFVLWSIIPTFSTQTMYGSELPQFVMFYLMGGYIRKYPENNFSNAKLRNWLLICCAFLLIASSVTLRYVGQRISAVSGLESYFYSRTSPLVIGCALSLFAIAVYRQSWSNYIVNTISSCTFGVYLFHDNPLLRPILWNKWINNAVCYDSPALVLRIIASVVVVFLVGTVIEYIRQKIFARHIDGFINKIYSKLVHLIRKV